VVGDGLEALVLRREVANLEVLQVDVFLRHGGGLLGGGGAAT
jgi:hypothetical protein